MDPYAYNEPSEEEEVDEDELMDNEAEDEEEGGGTGDEASPAYAQHGASRMYYSGGEARPAMGDESYNSSMQQYQYQQYQQYHQPPTPVVVKPVDNQPRGKPEAMTAIMMAAAAATPQAEEEDDDDDENDDPPLASLAAAAAARKPAPAKKAPQRKKAASGGKKKAASSKKAPSRSTSPMVVNLDDDDDEYDNLMDQPTVPISEIEYQNLDSLMEQFCRVPLLAEFSRPVKLLHPELATAYGKVVTHPVDLGHVCRCIRRRQYRSSRDLRLDMWRVFANCVKFHSHPSNKDKVPSFVSIALHLREYFNSLWQEYMLPSEMPSNNNSPELRVALKKRADERQKRLDNSGVLMMSKKFMARVARLLGQFIENFGCTDVLDETPLFDAVMSSASAMADVQEVRRNLLQLHALLEQMSHNAQELSIDDFIKRLQACYTQDNVLQDHPDLQNKFRNRLDRLVGKLTVPLHEANSRGVTQSSIWGNIATTIWARESAKKPYWPALCLGILPPEDQREGWHAAVTERNEARLPAKLRQQLMGAKKKCEASQKKQSLSFFLVEFLGTHEFIWVKEVDIVEKFDPADDPNKAQIKAMNAGGTKKRASRSNVATVVGSKTYATALEECEWATDEFEQVLQEAFDYEPEKEGGGGPAAAAAASSGAAGVESGEDGEFMNYSYSILNQSDEEAEAERTGCVYDESMMSLSDVEEANYLLAHEGRIDTSADARKHAKRRAQALRKKRDDERQKKAAALLHQKKEKKKQLDAKLKEKEAQKEQRELERRRKKRTRDREKQLKADMRKHKKRHIAGPNPEADRDIRGLGFDNKRARSTAIVKAFVHRMADKEEYKNLYLGGSSAIPSATVESSSLLCMALAFRVAAGELDDSDGTNPKPVVKPWEAIDTESPASHQERTARLEEKIRLVEQELERLRTNTKRRNALFHAEQAQRALKEEQIREDDKVARTNVFGPAKAKKKKAPPASSPAKGGKDVTPPTQVSSPAATTASSHLDEQDSASEAPSRADHEEDAEDEDDEDDNGTNAEEDDDEEDEDDENLLSHHQQQHSRMGHGSGGYSHISGRY